MATRDLSKIYCLLRNNYQQSKDFFLQEDKYEDKVSLLREDIELCNRIENQEVPKWLEIVEEINYGISKIKNNIKELDSFHQTQAHRPTFDEYSPLELEIHSKTNQIIKMLAHCQLLVKRFNLFTINSENPLDRSLATPEISKLYQNKEYYLKQNLSNYFINSLIELTSEFRTSQSKYLNEIERRENIFTHLINNPLDVEDKINHDLHSKTVDIKSSNSNGLIPGSDSAIMCETNVTDEFWKYSNVPQNNFSSVYIADPIGNRKVFVSSPSDVNQPQYVSPSSYNNQEVNLPSKQSIAIFKDVLTSPDFNSKYYMSREHEVADLTKSIIDLNAIFCDLSHIIADQGTMIDRIDYNIEQSTATISTGYEHITKAVSYHRNATHKKLICILAFALFLIFLSLALIITRL